MAWKLLGLCVVFCEVWSMVSEKLKHYGIACLGWALQGFSMTVGYAIASKYVTPWIIRIFS